LKYLNINENRKAVDRYKFVVLFLLIVVLFGFLNIKSVKIYAMPYIFTTTVLLYKLDTLLLKQKNLPVLDSAVTWVRMRKKKPVISNTGRFFCVSNLYNNSVVVKIYGIAYIFTLLMFRKLNKTTINKNKTTNFYRSTSFRFSFIFRYFKVFQVKRIVYI
jgi:hypothetical protein